ncbi:MAG: hypothetical protein JHC87_07305, partial [Thermoleophilaceae bacterium]|nr:hypothetical protein [Thermoleophilaceae bacterium]
QISVDFNSLPDITFSNFQVDMRSGSRALITNPTSCGSHTVAADITPNTTGGAAVTRTASFTTDYNGSGGSCPANDPLVTSLDFQLGINAHTSLPEATQVGKHPDVSIKVTRADKSETIRNLKLRLPNGFTGSAAAAPTCLKVDADAGNCATTAAASQLGTISVKVGSGAETFNVTGGKIFNTVAPSNRPALLTAIIPVVVGPYDLGKIIQPIDTTLDSNNFQLTAEASNLPLRHEGIPVRIREMQIDLAGYADQATPSLLDDQPFITNPHSCGTHLVYADVTSPRPQTVTASDTIDISGCPSQFAPAPTVTVDNLTTAAGKPTAIDVNVNMSASNDATVKKISMPFPAGFKLNAGGAEGTTACSAASLDANTCASTAKVGTSSLVSPLLNSSLTGNVYLETPGTTAADRYKLAVRLTGPVDITIRGVAVVDESTGDITATFDNLPDLPFSTFDMHLTGYDADGAGGNPAVPLILNPMDSCGTPTVTTTLSPYGGGNDAAPTDTLSVTGCPVAHGFTPTFDLNLSTTQAGASPDTVFTITRPETDEDLKDVQVTLPPGFMGSAAAVPLCSVADADAGTCAAAAKIGSVLAHVGYGADLLTVNGEVFMTAPQDPADIAGLVIRLPAVAGPYDLGLVNVKSRVILRSDSDFGLTTDFKAIPNVFKGVPIPIRDMALTINGTSGGNKVLYNASACSAASFDATFTSHAASTATGNGAYTPTGCASRSFQPTMHAEMDDTATGGNLKKAPSWDLDLSVPAGDSTVKNITTVLPPVMAYNLIPIGNQCNQAQIDAKGCAANSKYGEVSVTTPLLPYEVRGDIFMGDPAPGVALPRLVIKIGAPINLQVIGINDLVGGSIVSTFSNIPDLIFSNMRLHLFGDADIPGRGGILRLNSKASCTAAAGTATSHSGQTAAVNTTWGDLIDGTCGTEAAGCADPVVSVASKGMRGAAGKKKGKLTIAFGFKSDECYTLSSFQVRLPKGSTVSKKNFIKSLTGTTDTDRRLKGKDFSPRGKDGVRAKTLNSINAQGITITSKAGALVIPPKALCVGM